MSGGPGGSAGGATGVPVSSESFLRPSGESAGREDGDRAAVSRVRASVRHTRLVSIVIQRRPHCSATYAVVPDPHVGSSTRSPGSVVIRMHLSSTFVLVWTTNSLGSPNPLTDVSRHVSVIG